MISGASWILRGSYSKRMRCLRRYLANITSKLERSVSRLPFTLTCQSYRLWALVFSRPNVAPSALLCSRHIQPHDCVCPDVSKFVTTLFVFPQSHRQRQADRPTRFDSWSSYSSATSRPKRWPVRFFRRFIPCLHPQEGLSVAKLFEDFVTRLPQSHQHNHILQCLVLTLSSTSKLPKRLPITFSVPSISLRLTMLRWMVERTIAACLHPQDTARPFLSSLPCTTLLAPHVHLHSQNAPAFVVCENFNTVNCPKVLPVMSMTFPIVRPNNNASFACPAKLPRRRIQQKRRSYQYSTRARRLGNSYYTRGGG